MRMFLPRRRAAWPRVLAVLLLALVCLAPGVVAQQTARKATTVAALLKYPVFFHGQPVAVLGSIQPEIDALWLVAEDQKIRIVGRTASDPASGAAADRSATVEVRGVVWDVGRLEPNDPRLNPHDFGAIAKQTLGKDWPGVGELLVLIASAVEPFARAAAPGIRGLALDPARYDQQRVTLSGRFRGRNLYGDLPQGPGRSASDFVLQSADAAIWVTGIRPRGKGFTLRVDARVDTDQWLEVTGTVRRGNGLVWVEGIELALARPPPEPPKIADDESSRPPPPPPPEVIFSAPVAEETDVELDTRIRVQFSRDMDGRSFKGHVRIAYVDRAGVPGAETPAVPPFTLEYLEGNRVLEIRFGSPLAPFQTVKLELVDGIRTPEGQQLPPWTLTFSVGAS